MFSLLGPNRATTAVVTLVGRRLKSHGQEGLLFPVLVAVGVMAAAVPAQAKGPYKVRITGLGLAQAVVMKGADGLAWPQMTGFYNQIGEQVPPEGARLGPKYVARVSGEEQTLVQHL